jgi:ubiquinol-cytochrome c reductase iron-sulfur subunit
METISAGAGRMERRGFLGLSLGVLSGAAGFFASIPFVKSFLPSAKARGLAGPVEIDVSGLQPGQVAAHLYRGDTMLVLRRTPAMLAQLDSMKEHRRDDGTTIDPPYVDANHRAINPEYLVVRGVCTHLGCVPQQRTAGGQATAGSWWTGGFICPCHQSGFDYAGRVVRGPAPRDLPIPPHRYADATRLIIGEPTEIT